MSFPELDLNQRRSVNSSTNNSRRSGGISANTSGTSNEEKHIWREIDSDLMRGPGRGRGRGRGQMRGRGMGYNRGNIGPHINENRRENSNRIRQSPSESTFNNDQRIEPGLLEKRKLRFQKESEKIERNKESEFGLVSRGEDLRLQNDIKERTKFFESVKERYDLVKSMGLPISEKDKDFILMSMRKLREASLRIVELDKLTKEIFFFSIEFSISVGHHQSYIPAINFLLSKISIDNKKSSDVLSEKEVEFLINCIILYNINFLKQREESLNFFYKFYSSFDFLSIPDVDDLTLMSDTQLIYKNIECLITDDFHCWLKILRHQKRYNSSYYSIMKLGLQNVIRLGLDVLGKSYNMLNLSVLEEYMLTDWKELVSIYKCPWKLNEDTKNVSMKLTK
ncbi:unnamed protein product [[Candida] boidinii]|nr:unnamed protein product [[Candida] boidinii]